MCFALSVGDICVAAIFGSFKKRLCRNIPVHVSLYTGKKESLQPGYGAAGSQVDNVWLQIYEPAFQSAYAKTCHRQFITYFIYNISYDICVHVYIPIVFLKYHPKYYIQNRCIYNSGLRTMAVESFQSFPCINHGIGTFLS